MRAGDDQIRPMTLADAVAADAIAREVLFDVPAGSDEDERRERSLLRIAHLIERDPGGAWISERDGRVTGVALSLVRDHLWGLSLFAVEAASQGAGIGRRLIDATIGYGERAGARGFVVLSSEHPGAMRRYARSGLELHPCVAAAGIADLSGAPDLAGRVRGADSSDFALADAIGREVRGAGHGPDLPTAIAIGCELLVLDERAFVLVRGGDVALLAARDEEAASATLWAAMAHAPRGTTVSIDFLTAGQQWAITTCLQAGLALSPDGPLFTRGELGPLTPYIPSGAFL